MTTVTSPADCHYLDWAPLVGVIVNIISRHSPAAVASVATCTAALTATKSGYRVAWSRNGHRLAIESDGRWHWDRTRSAGPPEVLAKGEVMPLHDTGWIKAMVNLNHGRYYAARAVQYFAGLLPRPALSA